VQFKRDKASKPDARTGGTLCNKILQLADRFHLETLLFSNEPEVKPRSHFQVDKDLRNYDSLVKQITPPEVNDCAPEQLVKMAPNAFGQKQAGVPDCVLLEHISKQSLIENLRVR